MSFCVPCSRWIPLIAFAAVIASAPDTRANPRVVDDFEGVSDWTGLTAEAATVEQGAGAGRWADVVSQTSVRKQYSPAADFSGFGYFGFWLYSTVANGQGLQLIFDSDDAATTGADYYSTEIVVDWTGWRWIWLPKQALHASRSPLGWQEIQSVRLTADGWGHTPLADTNLVLDLMAFANLAVSGVTREQAYSGADFTYTYTIELSEPYGSALGVDVTCDVPGALSEAVAPAHVDLPASGVDSVVVTVTIPASVIATGAYLTHEVGFTVTQAGIVRELWRELVANPAADQSPPRMLLTPADFSRIGSWAGAHAWAADRRDRIIGRADGWPDSFLSKYGLGSVELPPEGGQWSMHYVCPTHGVNLVYTPPMTHRCPVDNEEFTGWPYDQVIYARQHNDLASAAKDAGLAYALTGGESYAETARQILLDYAVRYESYPIHNTHGDVSTSGARVLAQTLDESGWLIKMAWAYDLIGTSGVLSSADRSQIEQGLLRACAAVIRRNDAGLSNWQAWHNAAIAAAGRAIGDPRLVAHALSGPSGFERHMAESVLDDGFWYEGSWGYHFYTLTPMTYLAEMGARGGFDLFSNPRLRSMYTAPVLFAPANLVLPAFNDSGTVDLRGSAGWRLDAAYAAYADDRLALPLLGESRDEESLFWGAESLPSDVPAVTESLVFDASGYAVARGGSGGDPWYLALDYGPHGGWHGHYDKLGFVFFARGRMLGIDPGSHSYALPLHDSWDRSTIAHNTVTVDQAFQLEATGALERFLATPGCVWVRASAGAAYEQASLDRDLVMVDGYLLDHVEARATDGATHQYDWLYHNPGALTHDLDATPFSGFPGDGGYQHLSDNRAETTADDGRFVFSFAADAAYPGGFWPSEAGVAAESTYSDAQAHGGSWSNRLGYDFSGAPGAYVLFRTRSMGDYAEEAPTHIAVWVYGDGSGNSTRLRIVDATGESHVSAPTTLDFTGWQEVSLDVDDSWSHWSGNDDGVIDLPLSNLVFQLDHEEPGGAASGAVYLDDWRLTLPTAGQVTVEDYERLVAKELLWVDGRADTTFVVGNGIGPDLSVPVPYVMVRRSAANATFDALHVPHGEEGPQVTDFSVLESDAPAADRASGYRVGGTSPASGGAYVDVLMLVGSGAGSTERSFGAHSMDGVFGYVRLRADDTLAALVLGEGAEVSDASRALFTAPSALAKVAFRLAPGSVEILAADGELEDSRLLAPDTETVTYRGDDVPFTQDGDYILFGAIPAGPDAGPTPDAGSTADAGPGGDAGASYEDLSGCGCGARDAREVALPIALALAFLLAASLRSGRRRRRG